MPFHARLIPAFCLAIALFFPASSLPAATPGSGAITREEGNRQGTADKIEGLNLYRAYCVDCHGLTGAGDGKRSGESKGTIPNFTTPKAVVDLTLERMEKSVASGHPADTRKEWDGKLSGKTSKLIAYIREAFMLPASTEDASLGRAIYAKTCSVCHGDRGNGASWAKNGLNPAPFDFTSQKARDLSRRHMINTVAYGSPGTAMVGYGIQLSREQISAVVDYIRSSFTYPDGVPADDKKATENPASGNKAASAGPLAAKHAHADPYGDGKRGPQDMTKPFPNGLKGDEKSGKAFYVMNCAVCHGEKGDGKGPRAYFINPKPANFLDEGVQEEFNRPNLFKQISMGVNGTEMPAWSKVLTDQEIANVGEYVFQTFIRPGGAKTAASAKDKAKKK
jgi:mono/diheme cytochrome c family protein